MEVEEAVVAEDAVVADVAVENYVAGLHLRIAL